MNSIRFSFSNVIFLAVFNSNNYIQISLTLESYSKDILIGMCTSDSNEVNIHLFNKGSSPIKNV